MKKITFLAFAVAVLFLTLWWRCHDFNARTSIYEPIQSKSSLNTIQRAEPLPHYGKKIGVKRSRKNGFWQITLVENPKPAENSVEDLGFLSMDPSPPEITKPLYLCEFNETKQENITLDTEAGCSGGIKLHPAGPIGYSSKIIQQGHLAVFRCKSKASGYYLSLNSHCEAPDDSIVESLGAFLTHDLIN